MAKPYNFEKVAARWWADWNERAPDEWKVALDAAQSNAGDPLCAWGNRYMDGTLFPPNLALCKIVPMQLVGTLIEQYGRMTVPWICDALQMRQIPGLPPGSTQPYAIGRYEVTQGLYEAVMGTNPSNFRENRLLPVEQVNQNEAVAFCDRLTAVFGRAAGFRLPTEQEWEFAARAGQDFAYAGSNDPDAVAWTRANSGHEAHAVGQLKPNAWGLYDMSGNVAEWTSTAAGSGWVLRGGGWSSFPEFARVDRRFYTAPPSYRDGALGFRLAMNIPAVAKANPRSRHA